MSDTPYDQERDRVPGPDHRAGVPTQVAHPWVTTARTVVQTAFPAVIGLVVVLPLILEEIVAGMGEQLPEQLRLWLLAAAAFVTALAGTLARIFAIPAVNNALRSLGLEAPPAPTTP